MTWIAPLVHLAMVPAPAVEIVPYAQPVPFVTGAEAIYVQAMGGMVECPVVSSLDRTGEVRSVVATQACPEPLRDVFEQAAWAWRYHAPVISGHAVSGVHTVTFQVVANRVYVDREPGPDRALAYAAPLAVPVWNLERSFRRSAEAWLDLRGGSALRCVVDLQVDGRTRRATAMEVVSCPEEVASSIFAHARWQGFRLVGEVDGQAVFRLDIETRVASRAVAVAW